MKRKLAVICRHFGHSFGGAERYAVHLAEELSDEYEIHVFAQQLAHNNPELKYYLMPFRLQRMRWLNQWVYFIWIKAELRKQRFDIIQSNENIGLGDVCNIHVPSLAETQFVNRSAIMQFLNGVKILLSPRLLTYYFFERRGFSDTVHRQFVVVSAQAKTNLLAAYPAIANQVSVITPGIYLPTFFAPEKEAESGKKNLLFVGNDYSKKGLEVLLMAMANLPDFYELWVIGNSGEKEKFVQLANSLGLKDRVYFLGTIEQMSVYYAKADALIHPTTADTYAMVVLEAMAHRVPVIVSAGKWCGVAAELEDEYNALILNAPDDVTALSEKINKLFSDNLLRQILVDNGRHFAEQNTWDNTALKTRQLYYQIMMRRSVK